MSYILRVLDYKMHSSVTANLSETEDKCSMTAK